MGALTVLTPNSTHPCLQFLHLFHAGYNGTAIKAIKVGLLFWRWTLRCLFSKTHHKFVRLQKQFGLVTEVNGFRTDLQE